MGPGALLIPTLLREKYHCAVIPKQCLFPVVITLSTRPDVFLKRRGKRIFSEYEASRVTFLNLSYPSYLEFSNKRAFFLDGKRNSCVAYEGRSGCTKAMRDGNK